MIVLMRSQMMSQMMVHNISDYLMQGFTSQQNGLNAIIFCQQMSRLQGLAIAGFRSYSPVGFQKVEFLSPLTLICGDSGSGKTAIIEVLRYVTTGALPPCSDTGNTFLMDPKLLSGREATGEARLIFRTFTEKQVLAKRRAYLSLGIRGRKFECVEHSLRTKDDHGGLIQINAQSASIEKQIPELLGTSKALLENVAFCHQEQSLWPFSNKLKPIFDEMFETRRYSKIIEAFWEQHKEYIAEIKETKKKLEYLKRLHEDDLRRKTKALRDIEAVAEMASHLPAMQQKLEDLSRAHSPQQALKKKYLLGLSRGNLKEKLTTVNRNIQELRENMSAIQRQYGFSLLMEMPVGSGKEALREIQLRIGEAAAIRDGLQKKLQDDLQKELQDARVHSQRLMEISEAVKLAQQFLPEIVGEGEAQVLRLLESRLQFMETRRTKLSQLRRQADQVAIPPLLELPFPEPAYQEQKRLLALEANKLVACKREILQMFATLYKEIPPYRPSDRHISVQGRLQEVRLQLSEIREQLQAFEAMPEEEQLQAFEAMPVGDHPSQIIPALRQAIATAEKEEAQLQEYTINRQSQDQERLNNMLMAGLRKVGLDREPRSTQLHPNASPENFQEQLKDYQGIRMGLQAVSRDLRLFEERVLHNEELQRQREWAMAQATHLRDQISACEKDTLNYDLLTNISKHLAALLALRPGSKQKGQSEASSPEQINKYIAAANTQIRGLELERPLATQLADLEPQRIRLTAELSSLQTQLAVAKKDYEEACKRAAEHARLQLQLVSKKRQVDLKADLAFQEYYTPVEKEYPAMLLHLNTREAVANDIQAHCKALETALCAFHKEKMELINKYLAEIWREIYHGQDITLIEIQTAYEEHPNRRRSCSYAILMEKGGKKLEMKGRCSMGQKVLASIVIRLALAEVFGNSARILALDEPTTNLDREHIANLAHQLARLVEMNENKNLQMIIISQNLEFVRMMENYAPCYYEVSRDERNCSVITKKDITEIYEAKLGGQ